MKKLLISFLFICFLYLLVFPEDSLSAARNGLLLWYGSVLPVLFPFLVISGILLQLEGFSVLLRFLYRPFHFLFGVSYYGSFAVLSGFLCGFPAGAKITKDLQEQGFITSREARHLYGFVNNLSPGFLVSYAAAGQLNRPELSGLLLAAVLGAPLCYGVLTGRQRKKETLFSSPALFLASGKKDFSQVLDESIWNASVSVLKLGGYITLFCILSDAAGKLPFSGILPGLLFCSSLEVTGGIRLICQSGLSCSLQLLLLTALCIFGGFSALAQTAGIARMSFSTLIYYIKSRVLCTLLGVSFLLCWLLFCFFLR